MLLISVHLDVRVILRYVAIYRVHVGNIDIQIEGCDRIKKQTQTASIRHINTK